MMEKLERMDFPQPNLFLISHKEKDTLSLPKHLDFIVFEVQGK